MGEAVRKQTAFRQLKNEYGIVGVDEATLRKDADVADFIGSDSFERDVYHASILHNDERDDDRAQPRRRYSRIKGD